MEGEPSATGNAFHAGSQPTQISNLSSNDQNDLFGRVIGPPPMVERCA